MGSGRTFRRISGFLDVFLVCTMLGALTGLCSFACFCIVGLLVIIIKEFLVYGLRESIKNTEMIKEVTMYECECDNCAQTFADDCIIAWNNDDDVKFYAQESGWREIDGKWYCPECIERLFEEDEETGELIRKEEKR